MDLKSIFGNLIANLIWVVLAWGAIGARKKWQQRSKTSASGNKLKAKWRWREFATDVLPYFLVNVAAGQYLLYQSKIEGPVTVSTVLKLVIPAVIIPVSMLAQLFVPSILYLRERADDADQARARLEAAVQRLQGKQR